MVTRALIDFIKDERGAKTSLDAIRSKLKEKGWKDEDINEGIQRADGKDVPLPPHSFWEKFLDLLALSWGLYLTKWRRFVGVGVVNLVVFTLTTLLSASILYPHIQYATFSDGRFSPELLVESAGMLIAVVIGLFVLVQLWFVSTLYATALKTGASIFERCRAGLSHLPAVVGIKLMIVILLMLCFIPPLLVGFFTQNPLVVIVFFPFSIMGATFLGFSLSLALPAYFHGVAWVEAVRESMKKVWDNLLTVFVNYLLLIIAIMLVSVIFRDTGIIGAVVLTMVVAPVQVLFMLALYRTLQSSPSKT